MGNAETASSPPPPPGPSSLQRLEGPLQVATDRRAMTAPQHPRPLGNSRTAHPFRFNCRRVVHPRGGRLQLVLMRHPPPSYLPKLVGGGELGRGGYWQLGRAGGGGGCAQPTTITCIPGGPSGQFQSGCRAVTGDVTAAGGRLLAVGNAVGAGVEVWECLWGRVRAGVLGGINGQVAVSALGSSCAARLSSPSVHRDTSSAFSSTGVAQYPVVTGCRSGGQLH